MFIGCECGTKFLLEEADFNWILCGKAELKPFSQCGVPELRQGGKGKVGKPLSLGLSLRHSRSQKTKEVFGLCVYVCMCVCVCVC